MKLSKAQQEALNKLTNEWQSAYSMQVRVDTLGALHRNGLIDCWYDVGSVWSPRTCTKWRLKKESE